MTTYSELLRDPRWQKMRLKKLEAAEWKCQGCADTETTLNVHHKRYVKGRAPWEYDEAELVVLCEPCHSEEHEDKDMRSELMARLGLDGPLGLPGFIAYAAGSVSIYEWMIDETLRALLEQVKQSRPVPFAAGQVAASLLEMPIANAGVLRAADLSALAANLRDDKAFCAEFLQLLQRHSIAAGADSGV